VSKKYEEKREQLVVLLVPIITPVLLSTGFSGQITIPDAPGHSRMNNLKSQ
jgi:hypothetical protein